LGGGTAITSKKKVSVGYSMSQFTNTGARAVKKSFSFFQILRKCSLPKKKKKSVTIN